MQANADTIHATIEKKTIRAPFGGLGIRLLNLSEQLDVGRAHRLRRALSPVYVDFPAAAGTVAVTNRAGGAGDFGCVSARNLMVN